MRTYGYYPRSKKPVLQCFIHSPFSRMCASACRRVRRCGRYGWWSCSRCCDYCAFRASCATCPNGRRCAPKPLPLYPLYLNCAALCSASCSWATVLVLVHLARTRALYSCTVKPYHKGLNTTLLVVQYRPAFKRLLWSSAVQCFTCEGFLNPTPLIVTIIKTIQIFKSELLSN